VPLLPPEPGDILAHGKADLHPARGLSVSGKTGAGLDELVRQVTDVLSRRAMGAGVMTRARHRLAMERAIGALESARKQVEDGSERVELAAEELRRAIRALDSLVGRVDVEDLLDEIFASFCIGK
jgi:tRNA modification GTPase